ncbi:MAG: GxxExxY protein [Patescibacteria group bacterium]|jgi:GxxExxY protein
MDLVLPELSYQIVGMLFDVYNTLGYGHLERVYQKAIAEELKRKGLEFKEQVAFNVDYQGKKIGSYFLDFLIEDKVILEIKQGERFLRGNLNQVNAYLKASGLKLAILANFTPQGVLFKRLVNIK